MTMKKEGSISLFEIGLSSLLTLDNMQLGLLGGHWGIIRIFCHEFRNECWSNGPSVLLKEESRKDGQIVRSISGENDEDQRGPCHQNRTSCRAGGFEGYPSCRTWKATRKASEKRDVLSKRGAMAKYADSEPTGWYARVPSAG